MMKLKNRLQVGLLGIATIGMIGAGFSANGQPNTVRVQDLTLVQERGIAVQHQGVAGDDEASLSRPWYRPRPWYRGGYYRPRPWYRPGFRAYYRPGYRWMAPQSDAAKNLPAPSVQIEK